MAPAGTMWRLFYDIKDSSGFSNSTERMVVINDTTRPKLFLLGANPQYIEGACLIVCLFVFVCFCMRLCLFVCFCTCLFVLFV